jgi:hypothetical protein
MTTNEKIRAIEEIWEDLQHAAGEIPSPAWHADVLKARRQRARRGASKYASWSEAKRRIAERVK